MELTHDFIISKGFVLDEMDCAKVYLIKTSALENLVFIWRKAEFYSEIYIEFIDEFGGIDDEEYLFVGPINTQEEFLESLEEIEFLEIIKKLKTTQWKIA